MGRVKLIRKRFLKAASKRDLIKLIKLKRVQMDHLVAGRIMLKICLFKIAKNQKQNKAINMKIKEANKSCSITRTNRNIM